MTDALVSIGGSNLLYQVVGGTQELLSSGPFEISSTSEGGEDSQNAIIVAKVSDRLWTLDKTMPCLMTDEHTYTFAISKTGGGGPPTFYCLILSKDHSTPEDIELLQTILSASTAFSGNQEGAERNEGLGEEDQQQGSEGAQSAASWSSFSSSPALNKVSESFKRGGSVLGSQLLKAASFAKEKTGAVLTEERKQQISQTAASVSASVAAGARKVAEASKSAGIKVYEKVKESEALAKFGAGTKSALSVAYKEMQKASVAVVALVREAANKAARATSGEPSSPPIPQSAPPQAS